MPFTPAHAAAALPFQRTRLIPSALVIGCFSPDFEYFLRLAPKGGFGHTLAGLFLFDLPVSLLVLWLFHAYAKEPLLTWLPTGVRQRLPSSTALSSMRNERGIALISTSILIGAATHLLWDSFTHPGYWPYHHWHFLSRTAELSVVGQVQYYEVLQHLSTLAGLLVLLIWFRHWYTHTQPRCSLTTERPRKDERAVFPVLCAVAVAAAVLRGVLGVRMPINPHQCEVFLAEAVITSITVFWVEVVVYGLLRAQTRARLKNA
jgi:hypothetical protein